MQVREKSKAKRRERIISAARLLMRETGDVGFSMRALASRASVSIATPYNLFGSKQEIMFAVLAADLEDYQRKLESIQTDEIEVFFEAVSLATSLYSREPSFYKAVLFSVYSDGGRRFRSIFSGPRHTMWKNLIRAAIAKGYLRDDIDADAFAINLSHTFFSCILEWVNDQLSLAELEARVQFGFALALLAIATDNARERLNGKMLDAQGRLQVIWRRYLERALKSGPLAPEIEDLLADQLGKL